MLVCKNGSDKAVAFILAERVFGLLQPDPAIHFAPSLRRSAQNGARRPGLSINDYLAHSSQQIMAV